MGRENIGNDDKYGCMLAIIALLALIIFMQFLDDEEVIQHKVEPPPPGVKGMNYQSTTKNSYHYYTDEEIRDMREANPSYIIKAPGRIIKSRSELFEDSIEEYLENNPEELEEYIDKYKD